MLFYIVAGVAIVLTVFLVDAVTHNFRSVAGRLVVDGAGSEGQSLISCPNSPNCVSSYPGSGYAELSPWDYSGHAREHARNTLLQVLQNLPRTELRTVEDNYVHAVHRSRIFRFRDDLEFHLPADKAHIDFRATSRVGRGDLGVHEQRMRSLGEEFSRRLQSPQ